MRVISQDGTMDFPYDSTWVSVYAGCINGHIYVRMQLCGYDDSVDVADYSTKTKAIKAMKMLREEYLKYMEIEGHADLTGQGIIQPNFWVLPKVFQFPQDDEIEV